MTAPDSSVLIAGFIPAHTFHSEALAALREVRDQGRREAIVPTASVLVDALTRLSRAGLAGGAVYDCLIAAAARQGGATLVSLDRRAARAYLACGVEAEMLG